MAMVQGKLTYREKVRMRNQTESPQGREVRIRAHYACEVALGRMDIATAAERAKGDIAGANRHPARPQRA